MCGRERIISHVHQSSGILKVYVQTPLTSGRHGEWLQHHSSASFQLNMKTVSHHHHSSLSLNNDCFHFHFQSLLSAIFCQSIFLFKSQPWPRLVQRTVSEDIYNGDIGIGKLISLSLFDNLLSQRLLLTTTNRAYCVCLKLIFLTIYTILNGNIFFQM